MDERRTVGQVGEKVAAAYLEATGYRVLERNWRTRHGELDIVAVEGRCLVVCEVKTRRSVGAGGPLEAVTPAKLARLRLLTGLWLAGQSSRFADVRIDVVGVLMSRDRRSVCVEHLRAVG